MIFDRNRFYFYNILTCSVKKKKPPPEDWEMEDYLRPCCYQLCVQCNPHTFMRFRTKHPFRKLQNCRGKHGQVFLWKQNDLYSTASFGICSL